MQRNNLKALSYTLFFYDKSEKVITTAPSITRTIPVIRLSVLGVALLANTAAILAHMSVNSTQSMNTGQSGAPPITKWDAAPVKAVNAMMNTLVPTAVFNS